MEPIPDWIACPHCGFDDFTEDDVSTGESITCPDCGEGTSRRIRYVMHTSSEIAEATGCSPNSLDFGSDKPEAHDSPEVTEDGIEFIHNESHYIAGGEDFECVDCGQKCEMSCGGYGLSDVAYCNQCRYEFTRQRKELVDDVSDGLLVETEREERDVYEEYDCPHCDGMHPYTKPNGEYTRPQGELVSYEQITLNCPCGQILGTSDLQIGETITCSRCVRVYQLIVGSPLDTE